MANIGIELASKITTAKTAFEAIVENVNSTIESKPLSINDVKNAAFFSLKMTKIPGYDEISFHGVEKCFRELCDPLKFIFKLSLEKEIFPDILKIARVTPVFINGDRSKLGNHRPVSVLPCFSKLLKHFMYNYLITFTSSSEKTKFFTPSNLVFKLAIQPTMQLLNLLIKYLKLLKINCIHWVGLLTSHKPLIQ